jgi:hypothetical protein
MVNINNMIKRSCEMAKRKSIVKTNRGDKPPSLKQVFVDIANSIRYLSGESDTIAPWDMGNYIRSIAYFDLENEPEHTLPAIFKDIADSIRLCGVEGTMTPPQMETKIRSIQLAHTLENYCADEFVGKTMYCTAYDVGKPT